MNPATIRPHDILCIAGDPLCLAGDAQLALEHFRAAPYVVVRRAAHEQGRIPIGIRGKSRNERFAGFVEPAAVREVFSPESLRCLSSTRNMPAFAALAALQQCWQELALAWGPAGSVGFELATGAAVVHEASDLDLLLRADQPLSMEQAQALHNATQALSSSVDVQVETPQGAFALKEYMARPGSLLLRTLHGPQLVSDPWLMREQVTA